MRAPSTLLNDGLPVADATEAICRCEHARPGSGERTVAA